MYEDDHGTSAFENDGGWLTEGSPRRYEPQRRYEPRHARSTRPERRVDSRGKDGRSRLLALLVLVALIAVIAVAGWSGIAGSGEGGASGTIPVELIPLTPEYLQSEDGALTGTTATTVLSPSTSD